MRERKSIRGGAGNPTKLSDFICSDPRIQSASDDDDDAHDTATADSPGYSPDHFKTSAEGSGSGSGSGSPYSKSPWSAASASPWLHAVSPFPSVDLPPNAALLASLGRSEGHVYSLAASGDLLYTGSESNNIRVWKHHREFAGFRSGSGFVKAIVIAADNKIFTGHHDGKIRVWRQSKSAHRQIGTLPRLKDYIKSSINPSSYVGRRMWLRHSDAVSCLSLDEEGGVLYSGSWDRTVKVWRVSDSKCLESIAGHDDAVNSVAAAPGGVVFTGSADGTVKMWRREAEMGRHAAVETLMEQESAVTALAVGGGGDVVYCGSSDGAVRWWEMRGGTGRMSPARGGELRGHGMAVLCLATAGRVVVSGSADKTLCVWRRDGAEHVRLAVLAGHGGPVKCLTVEDGADGDGEGPWVVYSGSLDKSVRVWRVSGTPPAPAYVRGGGPT